MMLFNEKVLEVALSQIGLNIGWQSMSQQSMRILQTLVIKYIQEIGKTTMSFANNFNRSEALFDDLLLALKQMNINIEEVQEYMREVDCVPFVKGNSIPLYPCPPPKGYLRINFPGPEEIASRPEYMEEWLPSLNFGEKSDDKEKTKALTNGQLGQDGVKEGEFRPDSEILERKDGLKGERMNDHIYLSSVYIDAEGRVVGIGGREGVAPDCRLLPKDDYEEIKKAEEEEKARKRKKEEEENEKKKKLKLDENKPKVPKIKLKDKGFNRGRKGDLMKKKINPLARRENMKKKTTLSIKLSGLKSGTPTAKPSPLLLPRSPLEFPSKGDEDHDLTLVNSKETSKINEDYDNIINSVVERSRLENDLEPGEIPADDDDDDDRDFTLKVVDDVLTPKQKKIKKKVVRNKVKKKTSYDQTIDYVIKTAMDKTNEINDDEEKSDKNNVYTFSEENNFDVKLKEETGVDAKEAAKILVSLSEDASKKPKKINSKRTSKAPSPSPFGPPVSTFSEVRGSSQVFPKVSPGSTPMSPNSNPTMFNPFTSPLKSPPQSPIPTPPLFSSKSDFYQIGPHTSPLFNSNVMSPSHSTPVPLPKPPLKTLAEKKALPPINENLLLKKEKKDKKKKEKGKDKSKEKEKEKEKDKEKEKEKEREKVKEKEKHKEIEREDKKHDIKESKKTKKLKKTHEDDSRIEKKVDSVKNNSKVSLKTVNCHSPPRDIPSPASSSSSTKLVIRTPPSTEQSKEKKDGKKKKKRNNSASIEEPVKSVKQNVKEKVRDKIKVKEEKKPKDRSKEKEADASCVLITETITKEERGKQEDEWFCPTCRVPYDGINSMIGCDGCDDWYHWACVGIHKDPGEETSWFCPKCIQKQKAIETKVIKKTLSSLSSKSNRKDWSCPICRDLNPKGESDPMVECDKCDEWYHYSCVNILSEPSQDEPWFCPTCKPSKRPSGSKKRTKQSKGSSKSSSKSEKGEQKESGKNSTSGWSCLVCNKSNNSKPTICCDSCDQWFHFPCVGIVIPPKPQDSWFCDSCRKKSELI